MQWLVTDTLGGGGDAVRNYVRWLASLSIRSAVVSPRAGIPEDLAPHSALLLTGGVDVDPGLYGEDTAPETRHIDRARDDMEIGLIRAFLDAAKPVFGVCRGIQILNVALGGRLIQHIPDFLAGRAREEHARVQGEDSVHSVRFIRGCELGTVLAGVAEVNSSHHQAVHPDGVGQGLRVAAVSGGGIVEAVEGTGLGAPVIGIQWHPERWRQDAAGSEKLLRWLKTLVSGA